ncbi:SigE family RNA polymerase sigma factor [Dactylosporangium aurantiacum]|uniref:SigE family RNA polymerase sigma factor n=1 Tax=Dactylosporangium aurantiacum TaxID=35754 RepID=A0A9Q9MIK6_9ACTN|nr:SigE family RNA polymerase sigma factor [Dactylosporangium aurantiacum]MDG6105974.1 SigE family RNA polymerase sigma factor [Dactylosporangium aurantiacum]UWZ55975.1 SigE family RNA polymerase sigma factor [Dactylosporangium aurantiacum]
MAAGEFQDFVEVRYGDLLRTAYLLTGSRHAAEDLVQSSLLRVMRHWDRVDEPLAYVRRVMVNQRTSLWRRLRNAEVLTDDPPDRPGPDPTDRILQRRSLLEALDRIPARMRAVLVLRYWEDLSETDTAELLNISVGSVKSQASRGLARLRDVLGVDELTRRTP